MALQTIEYAGWKDCVRLANDRVELVVTRSVGPRIIRFALLGGDNQFHEFPDQVGKTGGDEWRIYGGHRLWHSPERKPRSYWPDNSPIEVSEIEGGVRALQPVESGTGIQKEMEIRLSPSQAHARVVHKLHNHGMWTVELAPWALSVMAPGGVAVVPQPTATPPYGLLPNRWLVLWPYSDPQDPRHFWGTRYILLRQDRRAPEPTKFGLNATHGWEAYVRDGSTFIKRFTYYHNVEYPDGGCSVECYTNADFLELESLGPLHLLEPGDTAEHVEDWFLMPGGDASTEESVAATVQPLADAAKSDLGEL